MGDSTFWAFVGGAVVGWCSFYVGATMGRQHNDTRPPLDLFLHQRRHRR